MKLRLSLSLLLLFLMLHAPCSLAHAARFEDCGDGTMADTVTGLLWPKQGQCTRGSWYFALDQASNLASGQCGLTDGSKAGDWHLPTIDELKSVICDGVHPVWMYNGCDGSNSYSAAGSRPYEWLNSQGFLSVEEFPYWSSSTSPGDPDYAWSVLMAYGDVVSVYKLDYYIDVWPVRAGQCGSLGNSGISGTATDASSGAPLAGVDVTISNRTYQTDASGNYVSAPLAAGVYDLSAAKSGYVSVTESVTLNDNSWIKRDVRLAPAGSFGIADVSAKYDGFVYYLAETSFPVTYTATVDWAGHLPGLVRFITSHNSYDVPTSGPTAAKSLDIKTEFAPCATLKVVAVSSDGTVSAEKSADFAVMSPILGGLPFSGIDAGSSFRYKATQGYNLTLVDEFMEEGTIPDDIPLFGKKGFNLRFIPTVTGVVESNGTVDIGLDWANKPIAASKIGGVSFSLTPDVNIAGEYRYPGCTYQWGGSVGLTGNVKVENSWPFVLTAGPVPVPMFAKASIQAAVGLNLGVENLSPLSLNGLFNINPYVRGTLGAGVNNLMAIAGWLGGGADFQFQYPQLPHLKDVLIYLDGGVTVTAFLWEYEKELFHWGWSKNGKTAAPTLRLTTPGKTSAPIPRDYLAAPNAGQFRRTPAYSIRQFAPAGAKRYSVAVSPIVTSVFPQSDSFLSSAGSSVNLLFVTDNPNRTANNRTMLVHSAFDGTSWSAPQPVADDGTADFHPVSLTFSDGSIAAAWEDEKTQLPDSATLDDAVSGMEISAALYDPATKTWGAAARLTTDPYLHRSPKLAGTAANNSLLTWIGNEANDLYGSAAKPNKLWFSFYDGTAWSTPQVAAVIPNAIKRYSVAYDGATANVVLAMHNSDNLSTLDNLEIYRLTWNNGVWGTMTRLTTDTVIDDNPQLALDNAGNVILTWVRGAELSSVVNFDFTNRTVIRNDGEYSSNLADFKQSTTGDGKVAIIYAQPSDGSSSDLFGVFYDPVFKTWGQPKQLTDDPETESHPSIAFLGSETVIAAYNRKLILNADGTVPPGTAYTDLYMLKHTLGVDLALDSHFTVAPVNPAPGDAATFTVTARNVGDKPVAAATVAFYNGNPAKGGVKIDETTVAGTLNAGESKDAAITWTIPATTVPLTIYAVIDPDSALDPLSRSDNTVSATIVMPDLAISTAYWQKQTDNLVTITATIFSQGSLPTTPTTATFRKGSATGAVLATQNLPTLVKDATQDVGFTWDITALSDPYYTVYIAVDEPNSVVEFNETNNSYSLSFPGKPLDLLKRVTINFTGSGSGTVTSTPAALSCNSGCFADFIWNTPLSLAAKAAEYSLFSGWSANGLCSGTGTCDFAVTVPTTIIAGFAQDTQHRVRIEGATPVYKATLQEAADAADTGSSIRAWGLNFTENLVLNRDVNVQLFGGYNGSYTAQTGYSTLNGKMTIGRGSMTIDRLTVR